MTATPESRWIRFLRTYGPIPTNDNMYDEKIQGALRRHKIEPIQLPTQFLQAIVENFRSVEPLSTILTGTAGDGKTFHCREAWVQLGGSPKDWKDRPVQELSLGEKQLFFVKDLSELKDGDGEEFVVQMAADVMDPASPRLYLVAANHGQLLEKFKASPQTDSVRATKAVIEEILVSGENPDSSVRLILHDLSQAPAAEMVVRIVAQLTGHPGWTECDLCPVRSSGTVCPIFENRRRLTEGFEAETLRQRLAAIIELSEQNGVHFSIRQLLALGANMLLGHPDAKDGLMSCKDIPQIVGGDAVHLASVYRNVFGENLVPRQAERTPVFKKLNSFGIGAETNNLVDNILTVPATQSHFAYANGRHRHSHSIVVAEARRKMKDAIDFDELMKALDRLGDALATIRDQRERKQTHRKLARFIGDQRRERLASRVMPSPTPRDSSGSEHLDPIAVGTGIARQKSQKAGGADGPSTEHGSTLSGTTRHEAERPQLSIGAETVDDLADLKAEKNWSASDG